MCWRVFLARGLKAPELLIVDGGKGLEAALAGFQAADAREEYVPKARVKTLYQEPLSGIEEKETSYSSMKGMNTRCRTIWYC